MTKALIKDEDVIDAINARSQIAREVSQFVHAHPELAHEEYASAEHIAATLEKAGFEVERRVGGMETAFRACLTGARNGRSVGFVAVYDAVASVLPDGSTLPVHSCGHGPLSGGVTAAAVALASLRDRLAGKIYVIGCPADEIHSPGTATRRGGKALSVAAGLWDGIDAALYAHPEFINTVSNASLWMRRESIMVSGQRSLRSGTVPEPMAALRNVSKIADEMDPGRVMIENVNLTGDVEEGTGLVLQADFLLFAESEEELARTSSAVHDKFLNGVWTEGGITCGVRPNDEVTGAVAEAFAAAGRDFIWNSPPLPFATDFGNISQHLPAALIGVGRSGGWKFHTDAGAVEFAGPSGEEVSLGIARVLALSATRLTEKP